MFKTKKVIENRINMLKNNKRQPISNYIIKIRDRIPNKKFKDKNE